MENNQNKQLKKRLRVFENITYEDFEEEPQNNYQGSGLLRKMTKFEDDSFGKEDEILAHLKIDLDNSFEEESKSLKKSNFTNEIEEKNKLNSIAELAKESNGLILTIPLNAITEQDACSLMTIYGEIEFVKICCEENQSL
jgi:hypothetical protein